MHRRCGFEIRDSLHWIYGSGFPKSHDVSKAIDRAAGAEREYLGQGEYASRKPRPYTGGTVLRISQNDPRHGNPITSPATVDAARWEGWGTALKPAHEPIVLARKPLIDTVANNVLEYGTGGINIDACRLGMRGRTEYGLAMAQRSHNGIYGKPTVSADFDSNKGRWPPNVLLDEEVAESMDRQSDTGGASRFFPVFKYQAKASRKERPEVNGIKHTTVKPLELMRWLVKLVTPPNGTVTRPICWISGTTLEAAYLEDFRSIGIELDEDYCKLIQARMVSMSVSW